MRVLVTRPQADGEATATRLRARGHVVIVAPLLQIETMDADLAGEFTAIIMTSSNAARAAAVHPEKSRIQHLPVFAVGARTAQAARDAGFETIISGDGDGSDLVRLITARLADPSRLLLYLAGEDRAIDLEAALAAHGLSLHTAIVYRAVAASRLPPDAEKALARREVDGVLHYSRRSAETFVAAVRAADVATPAMAAGHYCLSADIGAVLTNAGAGRVEIAAKPDENALFVLLDHDPT